MTEKSPIKKSTMIGSGSGNLNEKQKTALEQFKSAVEDIKKEEYDDTFYLRWLRARNYDATKAELMLRKSLTWRKQSRIDELVDSYNPPEVLRKYYPYGFAGHGRDGEPVIIIPFGNCDIKGLLHAVKKSEYIKYTIYVLEKTIKDMEEQSIKLGKVVDRMVVIFDLENFGMKHITWKPAMDVLLYLVQMHEANYPERVKKIYVVNTPKIFSVVYAIIRPMMSDVTADKVKIYGRGKKSLDRWREAILIEIDANDLPVHWGGIRTDENGDPRCPDIICLGGDVPQSYYMAPVSRLLESQNLETAVVNKGALLQIEKVVEVAGSAIRWEFKTEEYDIGFAVYKKSENSSMQEIIPKQRVNSHLVPEDGQLVCSEPGTYVICFDNSFSVFRPKKLAFTISIISPENVVSGYNHMLNGSNGSTTTLPNGPSSIATVNGQPM